MTRHQLFRAIGCCGERVRGVSSAPAVYEAIFLCGGSLYITVQVQWRYAKGSSQ